MPHVGALDSPLERADVVLLKQLLDKHAVLAEMLNANEPMAISNRPATTLRGDLVAVRRYSYVPEEFPAEAMGLVTSELPVTRMRDMRWPSGVED